MSYRRIIPALALSLAGIQVSCQGPSSQERPLAASASKPNIVFIIIDDMGIDMANAYGSEGLVSNGQLHPYQTPRMDAFAQQGMRFDKAFATPSCAPTRAQFLTGRYPFRTGIIHPQLPNGALKDSEITLASILRSEGYRTGMAGKWNLRHGTSDKRASDDDRLQQREHIKAHGFDESKAFIGHSINYGNSNPESEYFPHELNEWALNFISEKANQDHPFYLQYSLGLIHTPWTPTPLDPEGGSREENYLDMMAYADQLIGRVLDRIDSLGIAKSTLVIVAGDNGTHRSITSRFRAQDLQGRKLELYDLGSQAPFIVRWPGVTPAGSVYSGLMDFSDIFPTLIELGGGTLPRDRAIDGISFLPQLRGESEGPRETVYCQILEGKFVRNANYKWVISGHGELQEGLYDLTDSPFKEVLLEEPYTAEQQAARDELEKAYAAMLASGS